MVGTAKDGQSQSYEFNGSTYTEAQVGNLTIADSVQPYLGLGWRSNHERGLGFFSEVGVMSTDVEVSLSSSNNYEAFEPRFNEDLRKEEQRLEDEADELSVYPVAMLGISYTF